LVVELALSVLRAGVFDAQNLVTIPHAYFVACTADGFIAREDGSFDFFPMEGEHIPFIAREYPETIPGHLRQDFGVVDENRHFDAVLMGQPHL
jgi:hypothetical protein